MFEQRQFPKFHEIYDNFTETVEKTHYYVLNSTKKQKEYLLILNDSQKFDFFAKKVQKFEKI